MDRPACCPNCQASEIEDFPHRAYIGPCDEDQSDPPRCRCTMCGNIWAPAPTASPLPACPIHGSHEAGQTFINGKPICKHCGQFKEKWR